MEPVAASKARGLCTDAYFVFTKHPPKEWLRDRGGKHNFMDSSITLCCSHREGECRVDQVPIHVELAYETGCSVDDQSILQLQDTLLATDSEGACTIRFRITEISKHHRNHHFQIKVQPNLELMPKDWSGTIEETRSQPINVLTKMKNLNAQEKQIKKQKMAIAAVQLENFQLRQENQKLQQEINRMKQENQTVSKRKVNGPDGIACCNTTAKGDTNDAAEDTLPCNLDEAVSPTTKRKHLQAQNNESRSLGGFSAVEGLPPPKKQISSFDPKALLPSPPTSRQHLQITDVLGHPGIFFDHHQGSGDDQEAVGSRATLSGGGQLFFLPLPRAGRPREHPGPPEESAAGAVAVGTVAGAAPAAPAPAAPAGRSGSQQQAEDPMHRRLRDFLDSNRRHVENLGLPARLGNPPLAGPHIPPPPAEPPPPPPPPLQLVRPAGIGGLPTLRGGGHWAGAPFLSVGGLGATAGDGGGGVSGEGPPQPAGGPLSRQLAVCSNNLLALPDLPPFPMERTPVLVMEPSDSEILKSILFVEEDG